MELDLIYKCGKEYDCSDRCKEDIIEIKKLYTDMLKEKFVSKKGWYIPSLHENYLVNK